MSTRGSIKIANRYLYISSDAYPEFANKVLAKTMAEKPRDIYEFIDKANDNAGFEWIHYHSGGSGYINSIFEEYRYAVNLHSHTFHLDRLHNARHTNEISKDLKSRGFILDRQGHIVGHNDKTDAITKRRLK